MSVSFVNVVVSSLGQGRISVTAASRQQVIRTPGHSHKVDTNHKIMTLNRLLMYSNRSRILSRSFGLISIKECPQIPPQENRSCWVPAVVYKFEMIICDRTLLQFSLNKSTVWADFTDISPPSLRRLCFATFVSCNCFLLQLCSWHWRKKI